MKEKTKEEMDAALNYDKTAYPEKSICKACGHMWMQHCGLLCPAKVGGFMIAAGEMIPILPVFRTDSFFVPGNL